MIIWDVETLSPLLEVKLKNPNDFIIIGNPKQNTSKIYVIDDFDYRIKEISLKNPENFFYSIDKYGKKPLWQNDSNLNKFKDTDLQLSPFGTSYLHYLAYKGDTEGV